MKRTLILISFAALSIISARAQDINANFASESKAYNFSQTGKMMYKKEYFEANKATFIFLLTILEVTPTIMTDVRSNCKEAYITITSTFGANTANPTSYNSVLDLDEIPSCVEALEYILSKETTTKPADYTEVCFKTRDGLMLGAIYRTEKKQWQMVIEHTKYIASNISAWKISELQRFVDELKKGEAFLQGKIQ